MSTFRTLEDDVSAAFERACLEHDWGVAEYLFQALEAIACREGVEDRVERAFERLVEEFRATH